MAGSNNPLSEYPRSDLRSLLAGARSANSNRMDLLPTPSAGNDNDTSTSSTGLFSNLGDEASFVASRARDDAQGSVHGVRGEAYRRGASVCLESHRATAPRHFRASTTRKTTPPPDAQQQQGTTTSRRSAEAAELLLAPALDVATTAGERARACALSSCSHPWFTLGVCIMRTGNLMSYNERGVHVQRETWYRWQFISWIIFFSVEIDERQRELYSW